MKIKINKHLADQFLANLSKNTYKGTQTYDAEIELRKRVHSFALIAAKVEEYDTAIKKLNKTLEELEKSLKDLVEDDENLRNLVIKLFEEYEE